MDEPTARVLHPQPAPAGDPPHTGNRAVDEVLEACRGLAALDPAEQLARLDAAEQALTGILDSSRDGLVPVLPDLAPGIEQAS
ncbi:hypothetical protein SAMN05443377_104128 [Propionibacterium cyclohexanicum]|uniref:Uncharacterized protein n=1 Tax=Propionibacterium cyclohexanicum TaxID=64702 RepID=A0A1H9QUY4_9ACTN|nr:hypothetical protein [Propionibacterium cyclohexanicum]SER64035.1 hypothetical protein SAMN05443377_104128 [Propionibacterium cyclohexanicum]